VKVERLYENGGFGHVAFVTLVTSAHSPKELSIMKKQFVHATGISLCTIILSTASAQAAEPGDASKVSDKSSENASIGAHGPGMGSWGFAGGPRGRSFAQALERSGVTLSDDQVEQMTTLRQTFCSSLTPKKDHVMSLATELKDTLSASKIDDEQARKIFAEIKTEVDDAYSKMVDHVIAVAHLFTPDQRQKLKIAVDRAALGPLGRTNPAETKKP
jgi:Spy/CpxP family protein refolding chaperone